MLQDLKRKRSEEGFTLIELLIVIIILAILATIVIFAVGSTTKNAAVSACKTTVKTVQTAIEAYKADVATGSYPASLSVLTSKGTTTPPNGPWLKQLPPTKITGHDWAIPATKYTTKTGTFTVETKADPAGKSTSTATVCSGA